MDLDKLEREHHQMKRQLDELLAERGANKVAGKVSGGNVPSALSAKVDMLTDRVNRLDAVVSANAPFHDRAPEDQYKGTGPSTDGKDPLGTG